MDELTDAMKQTLTRTGWADAMVLVFALRFLQGRGLIKAFETYLDRQADEEEAQMVAEDADADLDDELEEE
jgi:hypothetical protein